MSRNYIIITVLLLIGVLALFLIYKSQGLKRLYKLETMKGIQETKVINTEILTQEDIKDLPEPVQKYLNYIGAIGKPRVKNFKISWDGEFKTAPDKEWVKSKAEQYSFIDNPKRLYFMKLNMSGLPVVGLHVYKDAKATMTIKPLGLITVADAKGDIMNKAETVTVFNDMCIMAPASLIDKRIEWETINPLQVRAKFNNKGIKISADLYFNEKGELINFISNDRYMTTSGKEYINAPWSTPLKDYKDYNGVKLASYGEARWGLPNGEYCYGRFVLSDVKYNVKDFK